MTRTNLIAVATIVLTLLDSVSLSLAKEFIAKPPRSLQASASSAESATRATSDDQSASNAVASSQTGLIDEPPSASPSFSPAADPDVVDDIPGEFGLWMEWLTGVGLVVLLGVVGIVGLPVATYFIYAYNDLTRRWERLRGLHADVKSARIRRKNISTTISRHLTRATQHERQVTHSGARRGGRGRGLISDNANGWPMAQAIGTTNQGMNTDIQSLDFENQRYQQLHREAEEYNALIRSVPRCFVAKACGFQPWRFQPSAKANHQPAG